MAVFLLGIKTKKTLFSEHGEKYQQYPIFPDESKHFIAEVIQNATSKIEKQPCYNSKTVALASASE